MFDEDYIKKKRRTPKTRLNEPCIECRVFAFLTNTIYYTFMLIYCNVCDTIFSNDTEGGFEVDFTIMSGDRVVGRWEKETFTVFIEVEWSMTGSSRLNSLLRNGGRRNDISDTTSNRYRYNTCV